MTFLTLLLPNPLNHMHLTLKSIPYFIICCIIYMGCNQPEQQTISYDGVIDDNIALCATVDRIGKASYLQTVLGKPRNHSMHLFILA